MVLELCLEGVVEPEHHLAGYRGMTRRVGHRDRREWALRLAAADDIRVRGHRKRQPLARQVVDGVGATSGIEHEAREHRVIRDARELRTRPTQYPPVVLDAVTRLADPRVGEEFPDRRERRAREEGKVRRR